MNKLDFCKLFGGPDLENLTPSEVLDRTSFDEMFEINFQSGQFLYHHHVDEKYAGYLHAGNFKRRFHFRLEHFIHPDDRETYQALLDPDTLEARLEAADHPGVLSADFRLMGYDGNWIWTRHLIVSGPTLALSAHIAFCYIYDIRVQKLRLEGQDVDGMGTISLKMQEDDLVRRDEFTGLLDGMRFFRPIQKRIENGITGWCIVSIYIEHYRVYADWYGLEAGRYLMHEIGDLLEKEASQTNGLAGYMGQEEFGLFVPYDEERLKTVREDIQALIQSISRMRGFSPIFGVAAIDGSARLILEYYNKAALTADALHGSTTKRFAVYDSKTHQENEQEYEILYAFQNAIENNEIAFYLQPQVRSSTGKIVGAETLARWKRPDGRFYSPAVFIPILEKYGSITRLDLFIWESVCRWQGERTRQGKETVPVSVNVSQMDIVSIDVPAFFENLIWKYGISVRDIKLEITESAYASDMAVVRDSVSRLQEMGFIVMMDDFGSGYSSLNMLRSLNIDVIKLDAQFLQMQDDDMRKGVSILESVVNMTKNLSTPIIVEGVETLEQVRFMEELGCRYMQGFFFYRPMPVAQFEELISDSSKIEPHGLLCKTNQQIRVREFLDENIFTDTMLNNVLGPVAFYNWSGDNVEIIRYNEQFYEMINIELEELEDRRINIQEYMPPDDREKFFSLLEEAQRNWAIGSSGSIRVYRPNGSIVWIKLKLFFIEEDVRGKRFYASLQDETELNVINAEMPGAYIRCLKENEFEFLYISRNFERMTGFNTREIRILFENRLLNMIHPNDRASVLEQAERIAEGSTEGFTPYRIRKKGEDYIYVAEQSQISDRFGASCWQCMLMDITEVMHARDHMRILSRYMSGTVLFLHRNETVCHYEVAIHGLQDVLGLDAEAFEESLNSGAFFRRIKSDPGAPLQSFQERAMSGITGQNMDLEISMPEGPPLLLVSHVDRVEDERSTVEYLIMLRRK